MFLVNKKNILISLIISFPLILSGCSNAISSTKDTLTIPSTTENNEVITSESINNSSSSKLPTSNTHLSNVSNKFNLKKLPNSVIKSTVDRVVDGDTVEIILPSGEEVDTRLLLIDTPETKHPNLGVQKFGPEASDFAKSVLSQGDTVYFELDGNSKTDKYGRYLGYLWYICDEHNTLEMYNERVVEEGLARVGYIYDQTKHLDALLKTEKLAKSNKFNIWSINGYVTDKGYDMSIIDTNSMPEYTNDKTDKDNSTSNNTDNIVYANGGHNSSNIYHNKSDAHGMKGAIKMTEAEATKNNYRPCSICY